MDDSASGYKPPMSISPEVSAAKSIINTNTKIANKLFEKADLSNTPSADEQRSAALRRNIQISYSPYAPRKRARQDKDFSPSTVTKGQVPSRNTNEVTNGSEEASARLTGTETAPRLTNDDKDGHRASWLGSTLPLSTQRRIAGIRERAERLAQERPTWHPPWRPYRIISGHLGWVRCIAFDASNEWFATGSADRTIKIWDSASGRLKLTLTGHVATVRALVISERHPYMFSVGEDKAVKCWDLEQNKVIRNYHGHLSGVYCASLHPTLDVLMTGGRDSTVRVWDVRTRFQVHVLGGHRDTVNAVLTQAVDPQIISASVDSTIRLWDLAAGRCQATLTNHKRGVRALAAHPREFSFASASADNIKTWAFPDGIFMRNLSSGRKEKLINALAVNEDGILVSGADDGVLSFWDYASAHCYDELKSDVQPGSLECESGVYALSFDKSGSRLVSGETDKTIRMWREDENATEESHPLNWKPLTSR